MSHDEKPAKSVEEEFRDKTAKYGAAYAALSEGFKGESLNLTVRVVRYALLAAAAFVVGAAVFAKVMG
jgi:propanediol dehydratase large subunit